MNSGYNLNDPYQFDNAMDNLSEKHKQLIAEHKKICEEFGK